MCENSRRRVIHIATAAAVIFLGAQVARAVADDFVDVVALCGPRDRIRDRLTRYTALPLGTFQVPFPTMESIRLSAELMG